MQIRRACAILVLTVSSISVPKTVSAITITPSDVLQVSFTTNPAHFSPDTPDLLALLPYFFGAEQDGITGYGAKLYDGSTLLGTYDYSGLPLLMFFPLFKSATSPYTLLDPTIVDFSSILHGTINGRIDFHLDSGTLTFNSLSILFAADGEDFFFSKDTWATVSSTQIVPSAVPEPVSLLLVGTGLVGAWRWRSRRQIP